MANERMETCDLAEQEANDRTENTRNIKSILTYSSEEFQEVMEQIFQMSRYAISQYEAGQSIQESIFKDITNMTEWMNLFAITNSKETISTDIQTLASIYLFMSMTHKTLYICKSDKKQLQLGRECIKQCFNVFKIDVDNKINILIYMIAHYESGYIYKLQGNQQMYKILLQRTMDVYLAYTKKEKNDPTPMEIINIFSHDDGENTDPRSKLTKLYADTMYLLGEFYHREKGHINDHKALIYKHKALNEYMNIIESLTQDEYIQCVTKLVELAKLLAHYGRFTESRHHLAAATFILQKYRDEIYINMDRGKCLDLHAPNYEFYRRGSAIVARGWAKYGMHLLELSYRKLLYNEKYEQPYRRENSESISSDSGDEECETFTFHKIEKDLEAFTSLMADDYLLNYNDIKTVFDSTLKWLDELKTYVTPEKDLTQYVVVILDISRAYKCFTYFVKDHHNWIKLHKYRLEILGDTMKLLDLRIHTKFCKRIWFELASIYSALIEKYFECTRSNIVIKEEAGKHINCFIDNIVKNLLLLSLYESEDDGWIHL